MRMSSSEYNAAGALSLYGSSGNLEKSCVFIEQDGHEGGLC
jgi:hypothetical protein